MKLQIESDRGYILISIASVEYPTMWYSFERVSRLLPRLGNVFSRPSRDELLNQLIDNFEIIHNMFENELEETLERLSKIP